MLGLYDKYYSKWFMTGERKRWGPMVTDAEKKKFRVAIRMVEEGVLEEYDQVCPYATGAIRKEVFRIIDGIDITGIIGKYVHGR